MTLKFNAATRINRNKMQKIVIEMFKSVDVNNEVFGEEAGIQEPVMVWSYKSNGKKQSSGEGIRILTMGKSFVVSSRARLFFSGEYWKTSIKEDRIAKKLKMRTCGKIGKLEIVIIGFS